MSNKQQYHPILVPVRHAPREPLSVIDARRLLIIWAETGAPDTAPETTVVMPRETPLIVRELMKEYIGTPQYEFFADFEKAMILGKSREN